MIRPALTYGALLWYKPAEVLTGGKGMAQKIQAIQGRCLRVVAGAYRATSVDALEAETHIEPLDMYTSKVALKAAARNTLSESYRGVQRRVASILRGRHRRGRTPRHQGPLQKAIEWIENKSTKRLTRATGTEEESAQANTRLLKETNDTIDRNYKEQWQKRWETSEKGRHSRNLQPMLTNKAFQNHTGLRRPQSSLAIQLRIGKIGFRAFLCERKVPGFEDPRCQDCDGGQEMTVEHVLLHCRKWSELRKECLARGLRGGAQPTLEALLGSRKGLLAASEMVWKAGILAQFRASDLEDVGAVEEEGSADDNEEDEEEEDGEEGIVVDGVPVRA
jgi:hypothetical protein